MAFLAQHPLFIVFFQVKVTPKPECFSGYYQKKYCLNPILFIPSISKFQIYKPTNYHTTLNAKKNTHFTQDFKQFKSRCEGILKSLLVLVFAI